MRRRHLHLGFDLWSAAAFLACIVLANYLTARLGMVPVGLGLAATAGTYLAGLSFVIRDLHHDRAGKAGTVAVIIAGALLSFAVAPARLAIASAAAFGLSELADLAVYAPLRRRGYVRAAIASNLVGSVIDSLVFLRIAGFPVGAAMPGQMVGKLTVTAVTVSVVLLVGVIRALPRKPLYPLGGGGDA